MNCKLYAKKERTAKLLKSIFTFVLLSLELLKIIESLLIKIALKVRNILRAGCSSFNFFFLTIYGNRFGQGFVENFTTHLLGKESSLRVEKKKVTVKILRPPLFMAHPL